MREYYRGMNLAITSIEQIFDCFAPGCIGFGVGTSLIGVYLLLVATAGLGRTAVWASIGEAGFVRFEFKLFSAHDTGFDREGHRPPS